MSQKIQFRRGVEAQRALVTPDVGEPIYTTDNKQLFIGDGSTAGGVLVSGGSSGDYVQKLCGTIAIAVGADSVAASGLGLGSTPSQVLVTVRKQTGAATLFASVVGDSITTDGFSVDLSGGTDSSNYQLDYLVIL